MGKIERFEDLNAWVAARKLVQCIYDLCKKPGCGKEYSLVNQIKGSSLSIMANIAEGFGRYGLKDSKNFYIMARGSLTETQSHLYVMKDAGLLPESEFDEVFRHTQLTSKLINGLIQNSIRHLAGQKEVNI